MQFYSFQFKTSKINYIKFHYIVSFFSVRCCRVCVCVVLCTAIRLFTPKMVHYILSSLFYSVVWFRAVAFNTGCDRIRIRWKNRFWIRCSRYLAVLVAIFVCHANSESVPLPFGMVHIFTGVSSMYNVYGGTVRSVIVRRNTKLGKQWKYIFFFFDRLATLCSSGYLHQWFFYAKSSSQWLNEDDQNHRSKWPTQWVKLVSWFRYSLA